MFFRLKLLVFHRKKNENNNKKKRKHFTYFQIQRDVQQRHPEYFVHESLEHQTHLYQLAENVLMTNNRNRFPFHLS